MVPAALKVELLYERVFAPGQLADLVAWFMNQRSAELGTRPLSRTTGTSAGGRDSVTFGWTLEGGRLTLLHGGRSVATYVFSDPNILRPYLENLRAPSGVQLTRNNPLQASDATDHGTNHPGVWLGFGSINGRDFWRNRGRIHHVGFTRPPAVEDGVFSFATENQLIAANGVLIGWQALDISFRLSGADAFLVTIASTLHGEKIDLVFGDEEEMGLGVRMETNLTEKAGGLVSNSAGVQGANQVWGKTASWASYARQWGGRNQGVAIFPAASNPTPTWWHSRDYGLIVANGFGPLVLPADADGKLTVKAGESLQLRYGVLLFDAPISTPVDFAAVSRLFQ